VVFHQAVSIGQGPTWNSRPGCWPGRVVPVLLVVSILALLVESLSGISGARRVLEILGITPGKYIYFDIDAVIT